MTSWSDPDEALYDVARKIERAVTDLHQQIAVRSKRGAEEARKRAKPKRKKVRDTPPRIRQLGMPGAANPAQRDTQASLNKAKR